MITAQIVSSSEAGVAVANRFIAHHWKVLVAAAAGALAYLVLPSEWTTMTRTLTAWNITVVLLLCATFGLVARLNSKQLQKRYEEDDPTAPVILVVVVVAAILSVAAIVAFLTTLKQVDPSQKAAHIVLATLTIVDSWVLVPTIYALHYADLFYSAPPERRPLSFPATPSPVFWDFAYFSFTIAAACQTADVSTCGVEIRKNVVAHSVISVLFNVSILGFAVNVTAGLLA
jgi:uncharacterized membrane protein